MMIHAPGGDTPIRRFYRQINPNTPIKRKLTHHPSSVNKKTSKQFLFEITANHQALPITTIQQFCVLKDMCSGLGGVVLGVMPPFE